VCRVYTVLVLWSQLVIELIVADGEDKSSVQWEARRGDC